MFSPIKNLESYLKKKDNVSIEINKIKEGINCFEDYIIFKNKKNINVYNRICDHAGGKIISQDNKHVCPIHNWVFEPTKGIYANGQKKNKVEFKIKNKKILIENSVKIPKITQAKSSNKVKIRFFNHAFLQVETEDFKFATDPWAIGPAFNTGWWLKYKTKEDWVSELNSSSFIYISHNHPDHLHPLTLAKVEKSIPIVVPKFSSDSTGVYIESLGFKNVYRLDFTKEYKYKNTNLIFSILKSGDFREDSGIYFSVGELTCLFDVDSNSINFDRLPNVDVYATSFAGGASGYPLMFDNYNQKQQIEISKKNKNFTKISKAKKIKLIKPKYFLPYAGFFEEKLYRDKKIRNLNQKNKILDYAKICKDNSVKILNVTKNDEFYFNKSELIKSQKNNSNFFKDISPEKYLKFYKKNYNQIDLVYLENYFVKSHFREGLILIISLVEDDFINSELNFKVDFSGNKPDFMILKNFDENKIPKEKNKRILYLKCRKESFLNTIYNKCPWEDLSIGFQCKVLRFPNLYNSRFWYYFTNNYITKKNIRFSSDCSNCEKIDQYFDNTMYIKNTL